MVSFRNIILVDCEWNDWIHSPCSKTCGGGTRTNLRTKRIEEQLGGICSGKSTSTDECNIEECPGIKYQN